MPADYWLKRANGLFLPRWYRAAGDGPTGWNPCCGGCTVFADYFTRADSTDLGNNWVEQAGSWSIASNKLQTSSANGICYCPIEEPDNDEHTVEGYFGIDGLAVGDQVRLISSYLDADNYYFAEYTVTAAGATVTGDFRLWKRSGGSNSQLGDTRTDLPYSSTFKMRICYGLTGLVATIGGAYYGDASIAAAQPTATDGRGGFGTGTLTGTAHFDDYKLFRHWERKAGCPRCTVCELCVDQELPADGFEIDLRDVFAKGRYAECCAEVNDIYIVGPSVQTWNDGWPWPSCRFSVDIDPPRCLFNRVEFRLSRQSWPGLEATWAWVLLFWEGWGGEYELYHDWALQLSDPVDCTSLDLTIPAAGWPGIVWCDPIGGPVKVRSLP